MEEEDCQDNDLTAHQIASDFARLAALNSVKEMRLPVAIPIPVEVPSLGPRINAEYTDVQDDLIDEPGCSASVAPYVVALALRSAWYGIWQGEHYVRFIQEKSPDYALEPYQEWHADRESLVNGLADELSNLNISKERQLLHDEMPLTAPPTNRALYFGLSLFCFIEADACAAAGDIEKAFDHVHQAHRALLLEHGMFMWEEATKELRSELSEASQKHARAALAKTAASARHSENRAMKQQVFEWCDAHMAQAPSMDTAASRVAGVVVPVAWRTVRDWMTEWKKLRSAGTA